MRVRTILKYDSRRRFSQDKCLRFLLTARRCIGLLFYSCKSRRCNGLHQTCIRSACRNKIGIAMLYWRQMLPLYYAFFVCYPLVQPADELYGKTSPLDDSEKFDANETFYLGNNKFERICIWHILLNFVVVNSFPFRPSRWPRCRLAIYLFTRAVC